MGKQCDLSLPEHSVILTIQDDFYMSKSTDNDESARWTLNISGVKSLFSFGDNTQDLFGSYVVGFYSSNM